MGIILGKGEADSSILSGSTSNPLITLRNHTFRQKAWFGTSGIFAQNILAPGAIWRAKGVQSVPRMFMGNVYDEAN